MDFAHTRRLACLLILVSALLVSQGASAQPSQPPTVGDTVQRGPFMVRVQLEPGALLARQNGPLTMGLDAIGLTGSVALGINVARSTAVGVEAWFGLALLPSMDITAPDFDGAGETVSVDGPSLTALLVGPNITHVFSPEDFSLSATAGITSASFDYDSYDAQKLPYNRPETGPRTPIPLDKTNIGWGFGLALSKLFPLGPSMQLGVGLQFRYLSIPDDAIYFADKETNPLRYRAYTWSITSFGANVSLMYF